MLLAFESRKAGTDRPNYDDWFFSKGSDMARIGTVQGRPGNRQIGIIQAHRLLTLAAPEIGGLVEHLSVSTQGEKAMAETGRHPELLMVL